MKPLLITEDLHHKNSHGLKIMLNEKNIPYKFGSIKDIHDYEYIYSPNNPINIQEYPNKRFLFGPHFSTFPNEKFRGINNKHKNAFYIQPSKWAAEAWINNNAEKHLPIKVLPFPVDIEKFQPNNSERTEVFLYHKRRNPKELQYLKMFLKSKNINFHLFDYVKKYNEKDYINILQKAKYGIILDAHESQGFAIEEALSCNVPLLVWNVRYMSQEHGSKYENISCSSIEYWDERCGEYFYNIDELNSTFNNFLSKLDSYQPRQYIIDNLSIDPCFERLSKLFQELK